MNQDLEDALKVVDDCVAQVHGKDPRLFGMSVFVGESLAKGVRSQATRIAELEGELASKILSSNVLVTQRDKALAAIRDAQEKI